MKKYLVVSIIIIFSLWFLTAGIFKDKTIKGVRNGDKKALVLSDFGSNNDFKKWETKQAAFSPSVEYKTEGRNYGKMVFSGKVECSNIVLGHFFRSHPSFGKWSGFDHVEFKIYNAGNNTERLLLKIQDASGKSYTRSMYLLSKKTEEIKIYVSDLKDSIDVSRIRQFNFFRWNPKNETVFYIDNIYLIPEQSGLNMDSDTGQSKSIDEKFLFDDKEKSIFGIGVENSINKIFREPEKFNGEPKNTIEISLARNEYEAAQLAIYVKKEQDNISIETTDLTANINGNEVLFDKRNIKCYIVGYVKTDKPRYSVSYVGWWPDPLEEKKSFNIEENTVQPVWIEVYAPEDTPAGEYSGDVVIKFPDSKTQNIKLKVKVWNFSLPNEPRLKTAFGFYRNRLRKMYPQIKGEDARDYAGRTYEMEKRYYLDMIKHKIMPISNFDLDDGFAIKDIRYYVGKGLSAFAVGKYGSYFGNNWPKDQEKLNSLITTYREYARILKVNDLIDKAYIYAIDEPEYGNAQVDTVTRMIHTADPDLKNMVCFHLLPNPASYPEWGQDIDIWCIRNAVFDENLAKTFRDRNKEVWVYVSSPEPPYPALVIDYPAIAYRVMPWMCWKYNISGYLYWCVNFWETNPWENPMGKKFKQNGNGVLYYPGDKGPVDSIRIKATRDGVDDYEYLYILFEKIISVKDKGLEKGNELLIDKAENLLKIDDSIVISMSDYNRNPESILKRRMDIAGTIEDIDRIIKR